MSLTIHVQPQKINLSGNPIKINVSSDTVTSHAHRIHLRIKKSGVIIGEDALPVINNYANFDISDYLNNYRKIDFNVFQLFNPDIQDASGLLEEYTVDVFETYDGDGIEHNTINIPEFKKINGGFSTIFLNNYLASNKNFYDDFIQKDKKFLSWAPNKKLTWNQHDFLFFIPVISTDQNIRAHFVLNYSDGSELIVDSNPFAATPDSLYFVTTSLLGQNFLSLETETIKILDYDITIIDASGNNVSETRKYYIDRNYYNHNRQFIFRNSIGAYDIIMLKGISESSDEIQRTVGFFQTKEFVTASGFTENYLANSGFLVTQFSNSREAKKYIIELLNSRNVFEIVGKELIPVIPETKKADILRDNDYLRSFVFEYKYAYSDDFFAPLDDAQYFNPIIIYRDGTISDATHGQTATLVFDARINADATINYTINWGPDVGITYVTGNMVDGIWQTFSTSILVPENAHPIQYAEITDSIGGRYVIPYNITIVATNIDHNTLFMLSGAFLRTYSNNFKIDKKTITNEGTAVPDTYEFSNPEIIEFLTPGSVINLKFNDVEGNEYLFPCVEGMDDNVKSWTIHDVKQTKRMFIDGGVFSNYSWIKQNLGNFYNMAHGATAITFNNNSKIYVPYSETKQKIFNP